MQQQQAQLAQQAQQAAQQGQQQYQYDVGQQNQAAGQYQNFQNQASSANQNVQDYSKYLQGAGSGTNLYNTALSGAEGQIGFDPRVLAGATQNLTQSQNALSQLNQQAQTSAGGYGLSGAQLGNFYSSQSQPLSNQVQAQGQAVGNLTNLLTASQNQANQSAGLGIQGEQLTSDTLNKVFTNAQAQAAQAQQQMQAYGQMAQQQGGLNSKQAADYSSAINAYTNAAAAMQTAQAAMVTANANAGYLGAETTTQNIKNQAAQAAAAKASAPKPPGSHSPVVAPDIIHGLSGGSIGNMLNAGFGVLGQSVGFNG